MDRYQLSCGSQDARDLRQRWNRSVATSVALMNSVLRSVSTTDLSGKEFDDAVTASAESGELEPAEVGKRIHTLLTSGVVMYEDAMRQLQSRSGKPSRLVRYWPVATVLLVRYPCDFCHELSIGRLLICVDLVQHASTVRLKPQSSDQPLGRGLWHDCRRLLGELGHRPDNQNHWHHQTRRR